MRLPNWVGDVVMATPALRALRRAHPGARIAVEGRPLLEGLLRGLPYDFLPLEPRTRARARRLRAERFDLALLLPDSVRAALGPFLARIPRRVGYARDGLRRLLLTEALSRSKTPLSMIERYLRLTRQLGCPDAGTELELGVERKPPEPLLVVTPGASFGSSKLWPPEHFARACDAIAGRRGLRVVLAPAPSELPIARDVVARMKEKAEVVDVPLAGLVELIARATLVLTNDTGPRHVAVALGVPAVVLMGPTDPRHTAHHLERQRVLREEVPCAPCHLETCPIDHRCMTRLAPERAVVAAEELLA